jgi:DNA-binding NarL/FixJ family response regulator
MTECSGIASPLALPLQWRCGREAFGVWLSLAMRRAGARIQRNRLMILTQTTGSDETSGAQKLRILLVDDHPAVRFGTRNLILQAYPHSEISEAGNAFEALEQLRQQNFDLVFLDLRMPEREGALENLEVGKRTLHRIREMDGPPVVVMSGEGRDRALVEEMMALGAATFVPKSAAVEVSLEAIRRALAGGVWLPPEVIGKGGDSPPPSAEALRAPLPEPITHEDLGITPREFEILRLALNGLTPLKISLTLNINHDNVKRYMSRLYEKFGTANQASLHAHFAKTGQTLGILRTLPTRRTPERGK